MITKESNAGFNPASSSWLLFYFLK